ncbi:MAG: hypothetical protein ABI629_01790 [bacterium]
MRHIARFAIVTLTAALSLACVSGCARSAEPAQAAAAVVPPEASKPPIGFTDGAVSVDALIDAFLSAVERKDREALHRLRVTKDEYMQIVVPGTTEPGQPPRQITEQPRELFWSLSDTKSQYAAQNILQHFGGKHVLARTLRFTHGTTDYLWYVARGQVRLDLTLEGEALPDELRTGTIAEVDGRYKFLAFQWNN